MTFPMLSKGQNMSLPSDVLQVDVVVGWTESESEVDASALLLGADGKVRSDADFVFYNQPESEDGSIRFLGTGATEEGAQARIAIDLSTVPEDVCSVALVGSVGAGSFGDLGKLTFRVVDGAGHTLAESVTADATTESAFVFGEVYRRGGDWKVRVVGQGWESGLAGLATDFGVDIDDESESEVAVEGDAMASGSEPAAAVVDVTEPDANQDPGASAQPAESPAPARAKSRGVRTAKKAVKRTKPLKFTLAERDTWQPARLFSVVGVGAGEEQERRATSALIATMQAVRPFARALCTRVGAPVGAFEGYVEVQYERGETKVIPDAVLKVSRGSKLWTGLLEVKTGNGKLNKDQIENYLDVARKHKYDVVITLSNDVPASAGELPIEVDRRKLAKIALRHLSWTEVAHEARMLLSHDGIDNDVQSWILAEFLRYLDHPRSGATEFADMGRHWVTVRDAVTAGTLRAGDQKALAVADKWVSLSRHLALRLTAELGVTVKHILPRRYNNDPSTRNAAVAERLASDGVFEAVLRIPETAGDVVVLADVRTNKIRCRTKVAAPNEGTSGRRLSWLLKQLKDVPGDVQVEAVFSERGNETCELLDTVRANPRVLTDGRDGEVVSFGLEQTFPMGSRRSGTAASFVTSVTSSTDAFYGGIVQQLREWVPAAPKQSDQPRSGGEETEDDQVAPI
ncbi:TerD family protein [Prescottella agglutinans]|uniref:Stress response protein SCP2 n=1 Tax=Prescottella agglutinans TaxID=1644129 RepID=A0ABT6MKJ9_9NOCA|nr:TerD family protein [Prescottella agglutinans]MDH6284827.1 stress response protein SCP2 [Prescottella agglutinans]